MPGFIMHLVHGQKILEKLEHNYSEEERKQFMAGLLMPDSKKGIEKECSHFYSVSEKEKILQIPDLQEFSIKYQCYMQNPFVAGYAAHLYLDKMFFEDYFLRYVEFRDKNNESTLFSDEVNYAVLMKNGESISLDELYSDEYLYGDYTNMNSSLMTRNKIDPVECIAFASPVQEVDSRDYKDVLALLQKYLNGKCGDDVIRIFDIDDLEKAIGQYADDFMRWYKKAVRIKKRFRCFEKLIIIISAGLVLCNTIALAVASSAQIFNYICIVLSLLLYIIRIRKCKWEGTHMAKKKWESNDDFKNCCIKKWEETMKVASMGEDNYIKIIYKNIDEMEQRANSNKRWWRFSERSLIILAALIALLNVVAAAVSPEVAFWVNISAAVGAALVSIFNGIKVLAAYKETWLRHSKSRSELAMECHRFAANIGEYEEIDNNNSKYAGNEAKANAKIQKFKENTTNILQEDYNTFFANMSKD